MAENYPVNIPSGLHMLPRASGANNLGSASYPFLNTYTRNIVSTTISGISIYASGVLIQPNSYQPSGTYNTTIASSGNGTSLVNSGGPAVTQYLNSISGIGAVSISGPTNGVIIISGNTTAYQPAGNYVVSGTNIIYNQLTASGTNIRISGLTAGNRYTVNYNLITLGSAATPYIRFNNDSSSSKYEWVDYGFVVGGAGSNGAASVNQIQLANSNQKVGYQLFGQFDMQTIPGNTSMVSVNGLSKGYEDASSKLHGQVVMGMYSGTSPITEIDFVPSAGYYSGTITIVSSW